MRPLLWLVAGVSLVGCLTAANEQELIRRRFTCRPLAPPQGLLDLKGVIHVHSELSWDSPGRPDEILEAARGARLRWVAMTDHYTDRIFTEGLAGEHDGMTIIRGAEVRIGSSSVLLLGLTRPLTQTASLQAVIHETHEQGGLVFIAHPRMFQDWELTGYDGLEVYDLADDVREVRDLARLPRLIPLLLGAEWSSGLGLLELVDRPHQTLARWDRQPADRPLVAIAGNDAHHRIRLFGVQLDSYRTVFQLVSTHVLAGDRSETAVLGALQAGRAYLAFDRLADPAGFTLTIVGTDAVMGDRLAWSPGQVVRVESPCPARLVLFRDGLEVSATQGMSLSFTAGQPGRYRAEAWLPFRHRWRPWVITNPLTLSEGVG